MNGFEEKKKDNKIRKKFDEFFEIYENKSIP